MRHRLLALSFALPAMLTACTTAPPAPAGAGTTAAATTFVVVRHAEKADDGSRDPPLSAEGVARARRLSALLEGEPVVAAYATGYQRTQQTATATASAHGLAVTTYAADQPVPAFAARLRSAHASGTVLVVGHSNTAPQIAAALCRCATTPLGDHDYGRVYRIRVGTDGGAALQESWLP